MKGHSVGWHASCSHLSGTQQITATASVSIWVTFHLFFRIYSGYTSTKKMADKLGDMMGRFGKAPNGLGLGVKLLIAAGGLGYAATQSVYTGTFFALFHLTLYLYHIAYHFNHYSRGWPSGHHFQSSWWHSKKCLFRRPSFSVIVASLFCILCL